MTTKTNDEFKAEVTVIMGVWPTYYYPRVVMSDGANQWSGDATTDEQVAWDIAKRKAKSYNEA